MSLPPMQPIPPPQYEQPAAPGFYAKLDILYLQTILAAVQRAQSALERLETNWRDLQPSEKRKLFGMAASALSNAESSVAAISSWRGRIGKVFASEMKQLRERSKRPDVTASARLELLKEKKTIIEKTMLAADVLLEPATNAEDLYDAAIDWITRHSEPVELKKPDVEGVAEDEDDDGLADFDDGLDELEEGDPGAH